MKLLRAAAVLLLAVCATGAHAQRAYSPGELESLLAPVALHPDPLLSQILDAARYPDDVAAAAAWVRANPQLSGDAALATVQSTAWAPSVKALVAYPEVLERMAESPQWLHDLGEAYSAYPGEVMATVQVLRQRAQASGYLRSDDQYAVSREGGAIVVQPVHPQLVYVRWYDPYVVYGGWTWTHRPWSWRPWVSRPHFVTRIVVVPTLHRHGHRHHHRKAPTLKPHRPVPHAQHRPIVGSLDSPIVRGAPLSRERADHGFPDRGHRAHHRAHHGGQRGGHGGRMRGRR
ncbi:MAG TPA: DUF3300 domain-containing protein [Burkholderiales bacterium]